MRSNWERRTDGELLEAARRHEGAFAEFYLRYEPVVATFLRRRCESREMAADLTAETFATALLRAGRFHDSGGPAVGWLLGIARNTFLLTLRRGHAEERARERLGLVLEWSDESLNRLDALIDFAAREHPLRLALASLPADQREAVTAYVVGEVSYSELSNTLKVSEATVRQRVSRGLSRLRAEIREPNV